MKLTKFLVSFGVLVSCLAFGTSLALASTTPTLNQTINVGALTTNIYQSDDKTPVSSPTVAFSTEPYSFKCVTSTATLGDSNDLLNVTNLASGINTWSLSLAATGGNSATWSNGSGGSYAYNNAAGSGCSAGQLSVDPSTATLTDDCNLACSNSTVTLGSANSFDGSTLSSITLMSDSSGSGWEGYLTGISLSQTIPALQAPGNYSLGMTITVTNT